MTAAARPLCADLSLAAGEEPIGTAPHWQEVTVLELDRPLWKQVREKDGWTAEQADVFAALAEKVAQRGASFGLLMSAPTTPGQALRVRHYTRGPGGFTRRDHQAPWPQSAWAWGLRDTLLDPAGLADWQAQAVPAGTEYHVCTHGTVDASCGKYGVPVHAALEAGGVRAWRTGHFGGHRFAATAVELPTGLLWARLTPELALRVARREVSPADVAGHLRGYAGVPPLAQVLDRELLLQRGWTWLNAERHAEVNGADVTLHYRLNGVKGVATAQVNATGTLQVPASSHTGKLVAAPQYRVKNLRVQEGK